MYPAIGDARATRTRTDLFRELVEAPLAREEDSGGEYALHELIPDTLVQSLDALVPHDREYPVKRGLVLQRVRVPCLQSALHDTEDKCITG